MMNQPAGEIPSIELRSDTFTQPTAKMREVIANAVVGDDMFGEDPSVNDLEKYVAELFGMESAVFCTSGSQSNQAAIWAHCHPGDEILCETSAHLANYESGGPAVLTNVMVKTIPGNSGKLDVDDLEGHVRRGNHHYAPTKLLCLENTTNIGGGAYYKLDQLQRVSEWAHENQLQVHVDGARVMNAIVAGEYSAEQLGKTCDTVSLCFSKGLGCPMGSVLMGSAETVQRARRARKIFGGALRQSGMMAAAAKYALTHHVQRLAQDHRNAQSLAEHLVNFEGFKVSPYPAQTNIIFVDIDPKLCTANAFAKGLNAVGVKILALSPQRVRMVTHLDYQEEHLTYTCNAISEVYDSLTA